MTGHLPPLRDVINRYDLRAKKSFGQNFLLDLNLTGKIARAAGPLDGCNVIEIGPGPGGLTRALLNEGANAVFAVEHDPRCLPALNDIEAAYPSRLKIIEADALKVDLATLCPAPRRIVANLPYNIATRLLIGWLRQIGEFESLTLMFQREVAERLSARPGTKAYGRLSVLTQWLCDVQIALNIPRDAFTPPPKVASSVASLDPRPEPLAPARIDLLEKVTAKAFGQRRKMLRSSLKPLNLNFAELGIQETARAEELTVEQFCKIAQTLE